MSGEFAFIDWIRELTRADHSNDNVEVGIGDDCAVLAGGLLFALDTMVEDVHFRLDWCTPNDVGWKALAVNLSDIAAMGGTPLACLVGLTLPFVDPSDRTGSTEAAQRVMTGLVDAASAYGCPLVGGDSTSGPTLVVSVAILGTTETTNAPVLRSGATPGQAVFVTGILGTAVGVLDQLKSGAGGPSLSPSSLRRLHRPEPRLREGVVAATAGASAMIDISDGLGADLAHICDASAVGVRVDADAVPAADGVSLARALSGGDDYELCFTAPDPERVVAAFADAGLDPPIQIGVTTTADAGRLLVDGAGNESPLTNAGWQHQI